MEEAVEHALDASQTASVATEEVFDAMRHTATAMFKQCTKDLTKVSAMASQEHMLERQMKDIHVTMEKLRAHHVSLEAQVEEEEQSVTERKKNLAQVHASLVQLDEEQQLFSSAEKSSERVTNALQNFFCRYIGPDAPLQHLMDHAIAVTAGRHSNEFRNVAGEVRRRAVLVREQMEEVRRSGSVGKDFLQTLQEWCQGSWAQHKELEEVVRAGHELLKVDEERQCFFESFPPPVVSEVAPVDHVFSPLSNTACERAVGSTEGSPEACARDFAVTECRTREQQVITHVGLYQEELNALQRHTEALSNAWETAGVCVAPMDRIAMEGLFQRWKNFLATFAKWNDMSVHHVVAICDQSNQSSANHSLEAMLRAKEADINDLVTRKQQNKESERMLCEEVANYAEAWRRMLATTQHQEALWADVQKSVCDTSGELSEVRESLREMAERREKERAAHLLALDGVQRVKVQLVESLASLRKQMAAQHSAEAREGAALLSLQTQLSRIQEVLENGEDIAPELNEAVHRTVEKDETNDIQWTDERIQGVMDALCVWREGRRGLEANGETDQKENCKEALSAVSSATGAQELFSDIDWDMLTRVLDKWAEDEVMWREMRKQRLQFVSDCNEEIALLSLELK